ncbi:MAG: hypothetical protein IPG54_13950 [Sphingomonadales bacterium]|nr:hypothetical protein [Sphingomonadales bacterium]
MNADGSVIVGEAFVPENPLQISTIKNATPSAGPAVTETVAAIARGQRRE